MQDRTGEYVDSQAEVGGSPDLPVNTHSLDVADSDLQTWLAQRALAVEDPDASPP